MKALRFYDRRDIRLDEIPREEPKGDEISIKVKFGGICGSDLHEYLEGPLNTPKDKPNELTGHSRPVTLGHEFCGEVVAIGPDVKNIKVGD